MSFPSIRYTQGKQEGIRMGSDRHLVCWEISLDRSERLPSPLPAPAHQMWGEGHTASSLCSAAWVQSPPLLSLTLDSTRTLHPHTDLCAGTNMICSTAQKKQWFFPHLCSSPPSPLELRTILHRSEATSSFCWSVRPRLGSCSWQALLSDRLNSWYGTKACWSSSQYSRLHGTWKERHNEPYKCNPSIWTLWINLGLSNKVQVIPP